MNSIRDKLLSFDTNEFIFALRREANHPACETLLFDKLNELRIYFPLQVLIELQRNLRDGNAESFACAYEGKIRHMGLCASFHRACASLATARREEGRRGDCRPPRSRGRSLLRFGEPSFPGRVI